MFPSSCSVSSDIWTPVMWRLGRKLNVIFAFVYFRLFVMWMHICGSLPSLFIDQPLEQARGASHGNPCECIDVIRKDLVCLIWCCPSCSHRLCTSLFILIFCFGSLLILSPCYVALSCSSPFSTAVSSLLLTPWLSHTSRPVNMTAVHTAKANISTGLTHVAKKMLAAAKGGGCSMCYVNKDCQISASCLPNTIQWQWHCTHSFPVATSQCQLYWKNNMDGCRSASFLPSH